MNHLSLAEVTDRTDATRNGSFLAVIRELSDLERRVSYVSPYASNGEGALIAIPEVGTEIIVCNISDNWYYLGATFSPEPEQVIGSKVPDGQLYPLERADPDLYKARGVPMKVSLKSINGAGITMSESYTPGAKKPKTDGYVNRKTEITSTVNKKISLIDSPAEDSIILDSGNGSKITISDNPDNSSLPSRAVQIETVGPQKYINTESQTDVVVGKGGRELQLLNYANGVPWSDSSWPIQAMWGNVNIQSRYADVNIFSKAPRGRVFIQTLGDSVSGESLKQVIQIETTGEDSNIVIRASGGNSPISIISDENDLNLFAGKNINMKCEKFSLEAGTGVNISSPDNVNIDGAEVHLASGKASPEPVSKPSFESTYGSDGITTY